MIQLPGIYSFDSRINFIDNFLNNITENTQHKFYILSIAHYSAAAILLAIIILTNNKYILLLCILFISTVSFFNYADNGCQLMKLERRYIGKEWFGLLTFLNLKFPNLINKESIIVVFIITTFLILFYTVYKLCNTLAKKTIAKPSD